MKKMPFRTQNVKQKIAADLENAGDFTAVDD